MRYRKIKILFVLVAATVLGLATAESINVYRHIRNKEEWSVLQAINSRYRSNTDESKILFATLNGYEAIGVRVASGPPLDPPSKFPRVWVLAAPKYGERVKKISADEDYAITSSDLKLILREVPGISAAAQNELRQHVKD